MEENQAARPNRREERKNHHPKEGKEGSTTPKERGKATPKKKETKHHHPSEDGEKLFCSEEVVEGSPTKRMGRKAGPPERRLKKATPPNTTPRRSGPSSTTQQKRTGKLQPHPGEERQHPRNRKCEKAAPTRGGDALCHFFFFFMSGIFHPKEVWGVWADF